MDRGDVDAGQFSGRIGLQCGFHNRICGHKPLNKVTVYRRPLRFEILEVLDAEDARERSRRLIAAAVGEPLAP